MASFSERLRELRRERGLTQAQLGEFVGVVGSTIGGYEAPSKQAEPEFQIVRKLADLFGVSTDYLLGKSDERQPVSRDPFAEALEGDAELLEFWLQLRRREDLKLLFKQVKGLDSESIKRIVRVVKAIEDEEAED